jgi:hypothetical protein
MLSDLFPLAPGWIIHDMTLTSQVREFYRQFYVPSENRPDIIFRFNAHPSENGPINHRPDRWPGVKDVFWYFLPEETGEYVKILQRDPYYEVYRRKTVPKD